MRLSVNVIVQLLATLGHGVAQMSDLLPSERQKLYASATLAAIQGLVAVLAHFRNPDGTPARVPYERGSTGLR